MRSSFAPSIVAAALLAACDGTDPSNVPPTAAFTAECDGLECTLRDGSTDSDGSIHAYQWDFGDNTGTATSRDATHAYAEAGVFTVTLRVTDDDGGIASATEELMVAPVNRPPSARFTFACAALACDFSDGSSDIGGSIASYAWDFGDGGTSTDANPSHVYRLRGDYMVRLIVTDDGGATASASRQVALSQANLGPNANFAFSCHGLACDFADLSTDDEPGGSLTSHVWAFGDGGTSSEQNPGHAYAEAGTYTVTLRVTDDLANSATASREITVPGTTPGGLTADFTVGCVELECTFSDRSTGDVAVAWRWSFGDGTTSEEQHPTHAYDVTFPTRFTVSLTVTGTDLDIRVARQEITVSPPLAGGVWRPRAPMPEARWGVSAAAVNGLVYVAGGEIPLGDSRVGRTGILAYDPRGDTWRTAGTLLYPVVNAGMAAMDGRIYVAGGSFHPELQIFDPGTGEVEGGPPLPHPMLQATATVLEERLHVIGVVGGIQGEPHCDFCAVAHVVFDPATRAWSSRSPPPGTLYTTAAAIDGKIHLVYWIGEGRLDVYDPATDSWRTSFGAPRGRWGSVAVELERRLYLIGGATLEDNWTPSGRVDQYDPRTSSWHAVSPLRGSRMNHGAAAVGGFLYAIAGSPTAPEIGFSAANERLMVE